MIMIILSRCRIRVSFFLLSGKFSVLTSKHPHPLRYKRSKYETS